MLPNGVGKDGSNNETAAVLGFRKSWIAVRHGGIRFCRDSIATADVDGERICAFMGICLIWQIVQS